MGGRRILLYAEYDFHPQSAQLPGGYGGLSQYREDEVYIVLPSEGGQLIGEDGQPITEAGVRTVRVPVERGVQGAYFSVLLENGKMEEFQAAVTALAETVPGLQYHRFLTFDQGYEAASGGIDAIGKAGMRLLCIIGAGTILLVLAYLLLCQGRQRRDLGVMRSLGASRRELWRYLTAGGFLPAALGILLGTGLSVLTEAKLKQKLFSLAINKAAKDGSLALARHAYLDMLDEARLPATGYLAAAAILLLVTTGLLMLHAALLCRKRARKLLDA